jgi:hypothetical protein
MGPAASDWIWAFLLQASWILLGLSVLISLVMSFTAPLPLRRKIYFRLGLLTALSAMTSWSHAAYVSPPEAEARVAVLHIPIVVICSVLIWLGWHDGA